MKTKFRILCCTASLIACFTIASAQEAVLPDSATIPADSAAITGNGIEQLSIPVAEGVVIDVVYIPGGTFMLGSPENEPFRRSDESPQRKVTVSPFFMGETEVTWDQFWAFYAETMSEGRTPPEVVYANNMREDVDAVSGQQEKILILLEDDSGNTTPVRRSVLPAGSAAAAFFTKLGSTGATVLLPDELDLNSLTPLMALNVLSELKAKLSAQ